jgi:S1-C subfamily serine protease
MRVRATKTLFAVVLVLALQSPVRTAPVPPPTLTTEELEWSVVRVGVEYAFANSRMFSRGSAVLLSRDGWFATAGHALESSVQGNAQTTIRILWPDGQQAIAERACRERRPDIGWFLIRSLPQQATPVRVAPRIPTRFGLVRVVGYPESFPGTFDGTAQLLSLDPTDRTLQLRLTTGSGRLNGLSGGAVLQTDGTLLGIVYGQGQEDTSVFATLAPGQKGCD